MNVKQLIEYLSNLDPNAVVVMSKDGEGNQFSPLSSLDLGAYYQESTWAGYFFQAVDIEENGVPSENAVHAVCLWPVN